MSRKRVPKKPAERWEWIKYQLALKGSSLSAVAEEEGVSRQAVGYAKNHPYPKMERAIARKLSCEPKDIWPERYAAR
jgi:Ner family transcriptional regulator